MEKKKIRTEVEQFMEQDSFCCYSLRADSLAASLIVHTERNNFVIIRR